MWWCWCREWGSSCGGGGGGGAVGGFGLKRGRRQRDRDEERETIINQLIMFNFDVKIRALMWSVL